MGNDKPAHPVPELVVSTREFFHEMVRDALEHRRIKTLPTVSSYLADLLSSYLTTDRLFDEEDQSGRKTRDTLAEMFLKAGNAEPRQRLELLKKLGDTSLYVSGYFGDSLQRKIIDVDYYVEMGGTAYLALASHVREDTHAKMYREFAHRFLDFVDALTYIRLKTSQDSPQNLLRLFDVFHQTGSTLARDQLLEKGLITFQDLQVKGKARPQ